MALRHSRNHRPIKIRKEEIEQTEVRPALVEERAREYIKASENYRGLGQEPPLRLSSKANRGLTPAEKVLMTITTLRIMSQER